MADPFADLDAVEQVGTLARSATTDPFADLDAQPATAADPFADLDEQAPDRRPTILGQAMERGKSRFVQTAADLLERTSSWLPGMGGAEEELNQIRAREEANIQANAPQGERGLLTRGAEVVVESLPSAIPAMAAGVLTAGAGLLPTLGAVGAASGVTEASASTDDFLREQGVDFTNPDAIQAARNNPTLMAQAREWGAKRGAVIGLAEAATGGLAKGAGGAAFRAAGQGARGAVAGSVAALGTEAAGGAVGEAGAQLATEGRVSDTGALVDEALGALVPGAVTQAALLTPGGRARAASEFNAGPVGPRGIPPEPSSEGTPLSDSGSPKGAGPAPVVPLTADPYAPPASPVVDAVDPVDPVDAGVRADPFADLDLEAGLTQGLEPVPGYEPLAGIGPRPAAPGGNNPAGTAPRSIADILADLGNTPGDQPLATSGEQGGVMGGSEIDPDVWFGATSREQGGAVGGSEIDPDVWFGATSREQGGTMGVGVEFDGAAWEAQAVKQGAPEGVAKAIRETLFDMPRQKKPLEIQRQQIKRILAWGDEQQAAYDKRQPGATLLPPFMQDDLRDRLNQIERYMYDVAMGRTPRNPDFEAGSGRKKPRPWDGGPEDGVPTDRNQVGVGEIYSGVYNGARRYFVKSDSAASFNEDLIFDSVAEAQAGLEHQAKERKKQEVRDAARRQREGQTPGVGTVDSFLSGKPALAAAKARAALEGKVSRDGGLISRRALVEEKIWDGAVIVMGQDGVRRLQTSNGAFVDERQISKTAMDYAAHLLGQDAPTKAGSAAVPEYEARVRDDSTVSWQHRQSEELGGDVYKRTYESLAAMENDIGDKFGRKFAAKVVADLRAAGKASNRKSPAVPAPSPAAESNDLLGLPKRKTPGKNDPGRQLWEKERREKMAVLEELNKQYGLLQHKLNTLRAVKVGRKKIDLQNRMAEERALTQESQVLWDKAKSQAARFGDVRGDLVDLNREDRADESASELYKLRAFLDTQHGHDQWVEVRDQLMKKAESMALAKGLPEEVAREIGISAAQYTDYDAGFTDEQNYQRAALGPVSKYRAAQVSGVLNDAGLGSVGKLPLGLSERISEYKSSRSDDFAGLAQEIMQEGEKAKAAKLAAEEKAAREAEEKAANEWAMVQEHSLAPLWSDDPNFHDEIKQRAPAANEAERIARFWEALKHTGQPTYQGNVAWVYMRHHAVMQAVDPGRSFSSVAELEGAFQRIVAQAIAAGGYPAALKGKIDPDSMPAGLLKLPPEPKKVKLEPPSMGVRGAASTDPSRDAINGVYEDAAKKVSVSTDGRRIHIAKNPDIKTTRNIRLDKKGKLTNASIEGRFPGYEQVIPSSTSYRYASDMGVGDLVAAANAIGKLQRLVGQKRNVIIRLGGSELVTLDPDFLVDAADFLASQGVRYVKVLASDELTPVAFAGMGDNGPVFAVIMPMRTDAKSTLGAGSSIDDLRAYDSGIEMRAAAGTDLDGYAKVRKALVGDSDTGSTPGSSPSAAPGGGKTLGDSPGRGRVRSVGAGPLDSGADRVENQPVGGLPTAATQPARGTIAGMDTVRVPFALPELLKLVRGVGLSIPKIYETLGGRGGVTTINPAGSSPVGNITIEASRGKLIQPKEEAALRQQAQDEAQLEADAMTAAAALGGPAVPQDFMARRSEELFKELYAARLDWAKVNRGQEALTKVVNHELGHIADALPPGDFSRGNILGRFFHSAQYLKKMMSVHPSGMGNMLTNADRARLQRQAEKAAGARPTDPAALAAWQTAKKNAYTNLLDAEAGARGLIQIKDVVRETDPLIAWWRGEERIPDYYRTPWERYAELMSMYALAPGQFQARAPLTYATLNNWLDRNPEYKRPFDELHKKIETGEHITDFERDLETSFDQADRDAVAIQEGRDRPSWEEIKDSFLVTFDRVRGPVLRRVDSLRKSAPDVYERVKGALKTWQYKDNANKAVVDRVKRFQAVSLAPADITWRRFGTYLFLRRVLNERYDLANPLGTDSRRATIVLEKWRNQMGAERFAALERAGQEWNALHQQVLDYIEATGTERPELWAKLRANDSYATFSVLPDEIPEAASLEEMIGTAQGTAPGPGVRKQAGTFRRVENPATATMKKWMQWMNHADRMVAIRETVGMSRDYFGEAQPANVRFIDGRPQPLEKTGARVGTLMWRQNGRVMAAYVPKGIADAFNDRSGSNPVTSAVRWAAGSYQALHTAWNPAFWPVGFAKDVMGTVARTPGMRWLGEKGIVRNLRPALKSAWGLHFGVADATAMRALDRRMLQGLRDSGLFNENDAGIERLMRQFGQVSLGQTRRAGVRGVLDSWNRMGQVFEHAVKIAGMTWVDAHMPNLGEQAKRELVRVNVGSPEFGDRGTAAPYLNFLMPFFNAAKQGWRQQIEASHAFESKTEYALKLVTYAIAPRLALVAAAAAMWPDDDEREAAYASIPARDKRLNLVLPLGWYDKQARKVAYIRIPQDETSALIGGLMETIFDRNSRGRVAEAGAQFVSSRFAPGDNNLFEIPGLWFNYYVNGQVSTDAFTNRPIMGEKRADAGGLWAAQALFKHSYNQLPDIVRLPLGLLPGIPGRFDVSDRPEVKRGMLEELTRLPGASRFFRVSNAGLLDVAKPAQESVQKARARELLKLQSAAADYQPGQPLGKELRAALAGEDNRKYFRDQIRAHRMRQENPIEEMISARGSKAEQAAVRRALAEVAPPAD